MWYSKNHNSNIIEHICILLGETTGLIEFFKTCVVKFSKKGLERRKGRALSVINMVIIFQYDPI